MDLRTDKLEPLLGRLDALLVAAAPNLFGAVRSAAERWRADVAALRFHLRVDSAGRRGRPPLVAVLGGTGTGKSTLVNRLIGANVSAASFRRTFTSGPVAVVRDPRDVPEGWMGLEHVVLPDAELPARGRPGTLLVVPFVPPAGPGVRDDGPRTLVDTPDLDGDTPAHHALADRAFRWAEAVLFLVTPEKYQMTEVLPYYRLARRYAVPALYVMNKCEEQAVLEDYRRVLAAHVPAPPASPAEGEGVGGGGARVFAVARDDAAWEPPAGANLGALRGALGSIAPPDAAARGAGLRSRTTDLLGRLGDQIIAPLREERKEADKIIVSLRALEATAPGVDVNPLTQQLRRRLQERSILYLIGPQRILDRVRQAPGLLMRLPRVAWDYVKTGEVRPGGSGATDGAGADARTVPDFPTVLADQFAVLQSRIDDVIRSSPAGARWLGEGEAAAASVPAAAAGGYQLARIDPAEAGKIAEEELAELRGWLEKKWNATPRDTRMLESLLKHLPGGTKLARWTEASPYLLTLIVATHGVVFGHLDLLILGGYGLATWLTERLSNEVAGRTRTTNARIAERYTRLAHEQIERVCDWLDRRTPSPKKLGQLEEAAAELAREAGL